MGIAVFFFITWLVCSVFAVIEKKLSIVENTFIFLLILVININFDWIIAEEMKRIQISTNGADYTAYLLHRSIIIPILAILLVNLMVRSSFSKSLLAFASILAFSFCLSVLSDVFKITKYTRWDFRYDILYFLLLYLLAFYTYKIFRKAAYEEVEPS